MDDVIVGAHRTKLNSEGSVITGKSYVLFGKTNGTAIDLGDIASASGTGGFVINGENNDDESGYYAH
ncbi:Flagellar hook-length control protein FliK [hydrothermal vent metagenome]|uniref:Flagellar hook-length control protein FliK n=1 Tax=hydrothermal vent metagenome TaxID=652676 RepID=A0A1W1E247_9ZZZZ